MLRGRISGWLAATCIAVAGLTAQAAGAGARPEAPSAPDLREQALRLESEGALLEAARLFSALAAAGGDAEACWLTARSYWRAGDALPASEETGRLERFEQAERWAGRGLEQDPKCGECALWKYAALGRLTEHHGVVWGARRAREMKELLDRGIALRPQHRDPNGNSALGNLYYASAVFHRMVPEWFWLPVVFGVKGDTDRALADIRTALSISSDRIDYQVEHGAVLLCQGQRHDRPERVGEGLSVLRGALVLTPSLPTDPIDQDYARRLLEQPEKACGFSRRGFIDVEAEGRRVAVGMGR